MLSLNETVMSDIHTETMWQFWVENSAVLILPCTMLSFNIISFLCVYSIYCLVVSIVVQCNKNTKPMLVKFIMCNKNGAVYNWVLKYFVNYPNWGVSIQFCMLQFLSVFPQFLPVFSTVLAKILFAMAKTQPSLSACRTFTVMWPKFLH